MASLAELMVKVGADISEFTRNMQQVDRTMQSTGRGLMKTGKSISDVGTKLGASVTAPLLALGTTAVVTGAKFDAQMSKVSAVSGATGKDFEKLRNQAKELGATTVWSATEAGEGMEFLARAGWKTDEIMSAMPNVLNLATASAVDLGTASDIASNIISGFGDTAQNSQRYIDVLAKTTASSNTDMLQLGDAMKYVAPVANSLGWSVEETSAAIGRMSDAGIQGSQAGTSLRAGLLRIAKPTKMAQEAMDELGISFFDAQGNMKPMEQVIKDLETATAGMTTEQKTGTLAMLFGQEAVSGWLALVEAGSENLGEFTNELENSNGTAQEMADVMADNLAGSFKGLLSALEGVAISFSDVMAPAIRKVTDWLTGLTRKFEGLSPATKTIIVIVGLLVASIAPLLIVIGLVAQGIGALMVAFGAISAPVLAVIAVIALVGVALIALWKNSETFREGVIQVFNAVKEKVTQAMGIVVSFLKEKLEQIKTFWNENGTQILQAVENIWNGIKAVFEFVMPFILGIVKFVWESIKGVINGALNIIMGVVKVFAGLFTGDFSKMWEGIKQLFSGAIQFVWNLMNLSFVGGLKKLAVSLVKSLVKSIKGLWDDIVIRFMYGKDKVVSLMGTVKTFLGKVWNTIKTTVVNLAKGLWNGIKSIFNALKSGVTAIFNGVKTVATSIWNAIKGGITGIVNGLKSVVLAIWNAIKSSITSILNGIKSVATSIWNGIKTAITTVINTIKSVVSSVFNGIKSTVSSIFNGIKSVATSVWNGIKTAITKPIESAKKTVLGIIDTIKGAFSKMKIKIPKPKLPKISVSMKKGVMGIPYPDFNVNWNAKGAIFNGATVLGGGQGVGEAGAEAVLPIQHKRYMRPFASAVADQLPQRDNDGTVTVENIVHTTIELDGEVVGRKVEKYVSREQMNRQKRKGGRR
ncbi:tail tape measure protein [Bacillus phage PK2]|nr:tail tape measure protein [Bacillus phage PK2]